MLPLYLITEHGFDRPAANTLLSAARVSGLFMTLAAGYMTDRVGVRAALGAYFAAAAAATAAYGLFSGPLLVAAIFIQPAIATCFFPPGFTALSHAFPGKDQNVATSLVGLTAAVIGQGLVPTLLGAMASAGAFAGGFVAVGAVLLICLGLLRLLPR